MCRYGEMAKGQSKWIQVNNNKFKLICFCFITASASVRWSLTALSSTVTIGRMNETRNREQRE